MSASGQEHSAGRYRAVFFDIGGVVVGSPFSGIADYEREHGLPVNYLNVAISQAGPNGAFQKLERGELDLWTFYDAFSEQLSDPSNIAAYTQYAKLRGKEFDERTFKAPKVNGRELFHQMMGKAAVVVPAVVYALAKLRESGYTVVAVTNNFSYPSDDRGQREQELILQVSAKTANASSSSSSPTSSAITSSSISSTSTAVEAASAAEAKGGALVMDQDQLKTLFDHYIESTLLGLRKPDPAIYKKACEIVGVQPNQVVFLDDIGVNLKSAQKVGLTTIKVELGKPEQALEQLEQVLGNGIKLLAAAAPTGAKL
ncbi:hypothetical protein EDD11_010393 [Mortierella claussenii]|nr:hypothetical protein EDD11_010393 [Mortierella claussenii]